MNTDERGYSDLPTERVLGAGRAAADVTSLSTYSLDTTLSY